MQIEALRESMHTDTAQALTEAQFEVGKMMFPLVNMYLIEQSLAYIDEKMKVEKDEDTILTLLDTYENVGHLLLDNAENIGGIFIDSPYYGEQHTLDQYTQSFSQIAAARNNQQAQQYLQAKEKGSFSHHNPYGICIIK